MYRYIRCGNKIFIISAAQFTTALYSAHRASNYPFHTYRTFFSFYQGKRRNTLSWFSHNTYCRMV